MIRSGIDVAEFARAARLREASRELLSIPSGTPVVGMIACLKPQKAPEDFVEIAARVHQQRPDVLFLLAGDGELRDRVHARVARLGLQKSVRLLGWRRDAPALMGAFDIFLLTSRWEGLPRVCLQAMAAGCPVVASRVDGVPEAVEHGRSGLLFPSGDVDAAAAHVLRLLQDGELRRELGQSGRDSVAPFDQSLMLAQIEDLYENLLSR